MTLSAVGCMICVLSELEGAQEGEEKHDGTSVESSADCVQTLEEKKSVLVYFPPKFLDFCFNLSEFCFHTTGTGAGVFTNRCTGGPTHY